ncbi:MAG TPA: GNAT family N-acetyltransferase [Terriglobales bacterium]|nr:GNAT family N-acetyltransferase [Terriglobales bacterium]
MEIYELDPIRDPRWERLVQRHGHGSVFHSPNWLAALQHVYGYEPLAISTSSPTQELTNGLVYCRVKSWLTGPRLVSVPFSDHCDALVDNSEELDSLVLHMKRSVDEDKWKYIEIRPASLHPGIQVGLGKSDTYYFHVLDLGRKAEELFRSFHKDCVQRKVRRAEREQLRYEEGSSDALLEQFYKLLVMTRRRQFLPPQPLDWFRGLIASFGEMLKIRVAFKGDVPVASILTVSYKDTITYKYGCSDARFNNLGGTPFLFWRTIQQAQEGGFEKLDMGRSDTDNAGLVAFKEHWGAPRSVLSYWRYPNRLHVRQSTWKQDLAKQLVLIAPDVSLTAVGRLLYRHIG